MKSLRRALKTLLETKVSAFDSLNNALQSLTLNICVELQISNDRDKIEEIITIFVIIFEIIVVGKSDFVDVALPTICKAASLLPIWAQARLACIWACHCKDGLRKLLETLQQLISLQVITGTYNDNIFIQDNEHIVNATKLIKVGLNSQKQISHGQSILVDKGALPSDWASIMKWGDVCWLRQ